MRFLVLFYFRAYLLCLLSNLDLFLPDNTKTWSNYGIFQYKVNKTKRPFFQQPKILAFSWFFKAWFFPKENPTQKFANSLGPRKNLYFLTGNSQNFETEYKTTVVDKTLVSNIPKVQTTKCRSYSVFKKCSQWREQPGSTYRHAISMSKCYIVLTKAVDWDHKQMRRERECREPTTWQYRSPFCPRTLEVVPSEDWYWRFGSASKKKRSFQLQTFLEIKQHVYPKIVKENI